MPSRALSLLALIVPLTALGVSPAAAVVSRLGGRFALDPAVSCIANDPRLAALEGGGMVAVWSTDGGIWARRFDDFGVPLFPDASLITSAGAYHQVAALSDGGFAVVWYDVTRRQIVHRRADSAGRLGALIDIGPQFLPSEVTEGIAVAAGSGGRLAVAVAHNGWLTFQEVGADGTPSSPLIEVARYGAVGGQVDVISPTIVAAPGGAYRVFWITWSRFLGLPNIPQGPIGGRLLSPPFTRPPGGDDDVQIAGPATTVGAAAAADGSYLLAWGTPSEAPSGPVETATLQSQRFTANDEPAGVPVVLESGREFISAIAVETTPGSGFAVAWETLAESITQSFFRLVLANGSTDGPSESFTGAGTWEPSRSPSLAVLAGGQLVAAWDGRIIDILPPCEPEVLRAQRFAVGCAGAGTGALCLGDGRFQATLTYSDPRRGIAGTGIGVPLTADTGYFWFFAASNLEVLMKVLDGRAINGHYWVFWGGVTDVGFELTVRDMVTGATRTYDSPAGTFASAADTRALPAADGVAATLGDDVEVRELTTAGLDQVAFAAPLATPDSVPEMAPSAAAAVDDSPGETGGASPCTPASPPVVTRPGLCLAGHRFEVEATWDDVANQGVAQPLPLSDDTGLFWFFSPSNAELVVKVLDGRPVNGRFWVFYGALTTVAYDLVVRHSADGAEWRRHSAGGSFGSGADTGALQPPACGCPGLYDPVCGRDGRMYGNACEAYCFGWVEVDATSTPPMCAGH